MSFFEYLEYKTFAFFHFWGTSFSSFCDTHFYQFSNFFITGADILLISFVVLPFVCIIVYWFPSFWDDFTGFYDPKRLQSEEEEYKCVIDKWVK